MAHIHLEDGSFTLFWVIVWWTVTVVVIASALTLIRVRKPDPRKITVAAFCTAAAFALSQVEIPIAGGVHISFTPLIGILTGPALGSLVVFVTNILSAAIGHGGWGMIGANTLVNLSEVLVAFGMYRGLKRFLSGDFSAAGIAALAGLLLGNIVMIAVVLVSGIQGVNQSPDQILAGLSLIAVINTAVAVIEALLTGLVVSYLAKMRPDLLAEKR